MLPLCRESAKVAWLAERRLDAVLGKRLSPEDVVSEAYARAATRLDYFAAHDEIPVFYKLRTVLLQTIGDIERRNLKAQGRDAYRERTIRDEMSEFSVGVRASELVADITHRSPGWIETSGIFFFAGLFCLCRRTTASF